MSQANIIIEVYCLLITIILQACNFITTQKRKRTRRESILFAMLFMNAVIIISFIVTTAIDGHIEYASLNTVSTGICYAGGAFLTELFGEYIFAIINDGEKVNRWRKYVLRTICITIIALDLISIWTGIYFSTENGYHIRGPYYMLNQILVLCVMMAEFVYVLIKIKQIGREAYSLSMYGFIPAVAVILQIYAKQYVLMYPAVTLSLLIIYIVSYINKTEQLNEKNDQLMAAMAETERAKKAAEEANASKSEFLSSMSHDIRTPLNAIIGMTDMAIDNIDNKKQALDNLEVVQASSKHLISLVNDVLDLSMIESGKIKIAETEFILPDLLVEVEKIVWPLTKAKNQQFILEADHVHDEFLIGDKPRIKQILVNFLSNAVKYTPSDGKIVLSIREDVKEDGQNAVLTMSCTDNGIGIDKRMQAHIFEPFVREVKSTVNRVEGTGLGLAIVHNIVEAMHGTVSVVSEKGKGSTFTASVPIRVGDEKKMLEQFAEVSRYSVLVVADTEELCEHIKKVYPLEIGTPCDTATSEQIIAEQFPANTYDAIICISEEKAVAIITKLRKRYPTVNIIYGCQMKMLDQEPQILNAGADAVLYRPAFRATLFEEYQALKLKKNTAAGTDQYLRGRNILVVEDQAINYKIIEHILRNAGAFVWQAENGMVAVDMFNGSNPGQYDLIMMDIMMPVMDGYTATMKIRNADRPDGRTIPIVAMTANAFAEDIQKSKDIGMNAHLSKPLEPDVVKDTLIRLFSQKQ